MSEAVYDLNCKHCNEEISSVDDVPNHPCFLNREVYMDDNGTLFTRELEIDISYTSSHNESTNENFQPDPNGTQPTCKQTATWNSNSIKALLSLYEANLHMRDNPKKQTKIWAAISEGLKDLNIQVSHDQVRWKINYLLKKFKECVDNNSKSGRAPMTFEFYDQMEDIFKTERNASAVHTISSSLPAIKAQNSMVAPRSQKKIVQNTDNGTPAEKPPMIAENSRANTNITKEALIDPANLSTSEINLTKKKSKLPRGTGSNRSRLKMEIEKQWLEHLKTDEVRRADQAVKMDRVLKTKNEGLNLKKRQLEMHEKQIDAKKTIAANKLKFNERKHDELMEMEKLKCQLLKRMLSKKEAISDNSDSE